MKDEPKQDETKDEPKEKATPKESVEPAKEAGPVELKGNEQKNQEQTDARKSDSNGKPQLETQIKTAPALEASAPAASTRDVVSKQEHTVKSGTLIYVESSFEFYS